MTGFKSIVALSFLATAACQNSSYELLPFPEDAPNNSIVNGESANAGEFPWYSVFSGGTLCGGALIAEDIVVTAAHCIDGGGPPAVRVGATNAGNGVGVQVCDSIAHPSYRAQELENDIAILVLCDPVTNNELATFNTNPDVPAANAQLTAMGFGRTSNNGGGSNTLLRLDMDYVDDAECANRYGDHDSNFNLCVDNPNGGICFGDSGGPVVNDAGLVMGVASFIIQACDSNFPDFYTRMSSYSTWVERTVCDESANPPDSIDCQGVGDDDGPDGGGGGAEDCILLDLLETFIDFLGGILGGE